MLRRLCVVLCLLSWDGLTAQAEEEPTLVTGSFEPGKIGLHATWVSGRVNKIDEGGQGEREGVQVGMVMVNVDDEDYSEARLDKAIAGNRDYQVTFKKFPPLPMEKKEDEVPAKPDFVFATELTAKTFQEQVYKVTNWTGIGKISDPPYYPVVLFHVSWCKHCKHSLPEFEKAAQTVDEAHQKGQLRHLEAIPKFFVIECDLIPEHKTLCEMYTGTNYPVTKLFRDQHAVHFNRPRMAQTYAWWATHVARRPVSELRDEDLVEVEKQRGPLFVLSAKTDDAISIENWREVALDYIEDYHFVYVKAGSQTAARLPPAPSVGVLGSGMEPLPFEGDLLYHDLAEWVNINQFEAVTDLEPYNGHTLKKSGLVVVTLVYNANTGAGLKTQFDFIAKQLRLGRQFLFATIDVSKEEHGDYLEHVFPLLSPKTAPPPRVFAFSGDGTYWEDPSFTDPTTISKETIESLLANSEALQDGSNSALFKEKRKRVVRFAMSSNLGLAITLGVPLAAVIGAWLCMKALCGGSDDDPEKIEKTD